MLPKPWTDASIQPSWAVKWANRWPNGAQQWCSPRQVAHLPPHDGSRADQDSRGGMLDRLYGWDDWYPAAVTRPQCMDYFWETQPNPNPLTPWFHALPLVVKRSGVAVNHFVELVAPFVGLRSLNVVYPCAALSRAPVGCAAVGWPDSDRLPVVQSALLAVTEAG